MKKNNPKILKEDLEKEKLVHDLMHKLIKVVEGHPVEVGGMAMLTLLVTNSGLKKEDFMHVVDGLWDHYNKERTCEK